MAAVKQNDDSLQYVPKEMRSEIAASMNANHSQQSEQTQAVEQAQASPEQQQTEVRAADANASNANQGTAEQKEARVKQDAPVQAEAPKPHVAEPAQQEPEQQQAAQAINPKAQEGGYDPYQRVRDMEAQGQAQIDQEKSKGTYAVNDQANMGSLSEQGNQAKQASSEVSKGQREDKEKAIAM